MICSTGFRLSLVFLTVGLALGSANAGRSHSPEVALAAIKAGNDRFAAGKPVRPNQDPAKRREVATKQTPHTVVVTCSDSRLSPELIFDQGLGDLFVVRTAGNTVDAENLGSIEYATSVLGARLVIVLGHDKCGAVEAAIGKGKLPGNLPAVVRPIKRSVGKESELGKAIAQNVRSVRETLAIKNRVTATQVANGQIQVRGAVYDLQSGKVVLLD